MQSSKRSVSTYSNDAASTLSHKNPQNAAFQLIRTMSHCSLDWFLKPTAGHPVATYKTRRLTKSNDAVTHASIATHSCSFSRNTIPPRDWFFNSSTGHSLTSATTARRNTSATTAFPFPPAASYSNHQIPILPVVGYSTVDSIFGGIRQLLIFKFTASRSHKNDSVTIVNQNTLEPDLSTLAQNRSHETTTYEAKRATTLSAQISQTTNRSLKPATLTSSIQS
ncbi:hypothetical protein F511_33163 [Dorcoceras hygrometricum]|uniref:Uncharacterized protein n=1 Tax=Dorcoceras hygrometricum TaxID=472368 RepID=A0A2Z7BWU0_9LAMI|nr:hypothetical protein F511_33163 [Dorcoceras hygrometricum]